MHTKILKTLPVSAAELEKLEKYREQNIEAEIDAVAKNFETILDDLKPADKTFVMMKDKQVWFDRLNAAIYPKFESFTLPKFKTAGQPQRNYSVDFEGFHFVAMTVAECERSFTKNAQNPYRDGNVFKYFPVREHLILTEKIDNAGNGYFCNTNGNVDWWNDNDEITLVPICRFKGKDSNGVNFVEAVKLWIKHGLIPEGLSAEVERKFNWLLKYKDFYSIDDSKIILDKQKILQAIQRGESFDFLPDAQKNSTATEITGDEKFIAKLKENLLNCDKIRANLDAYDANLLTDPNRGHWDLWDLEIGEEGGQITLVEGLTARNPVADLNAGIVGIDFGTKSTVVVYENENGKIMPLQVGSGNYLDGVKRENYENPTVIEFVHLKEFEEAYFARAGRPHTRWEDVTVSHTAATNLLNTTDSKNYYSFLENIKQWCGATRKNIRLRDKNGEERELPDFLEIADNQLNPLEIYAYYLGLYINHMMQERHIFMEYILSFPVTYEKNIREKMLKSFSRGLKKSLPTALLSDERAMKKFRVVEGTSEPAAYAITALESFNYPRDGEEIYYAVFDFGGGTTDFDFGVFRESDADRYDYVLTHFGANGDKTLGGENLLRLLAFEVFKLNVNKLLKPDGDKKVKIPFTWAADKKDFPGSEAIIRDSQEANLNMYNLMKVLRPLWEDPTSDEAKKIRDSGKVDVDLFCDDGTQMPNFELVTIPANNSAEENNLPAEKNVDVCYLEKILLDRITGGVDNFFIALREAFDRSSGGSANGIAPLSDVNEIAIFLAGNSSKSALVKNIFETYTATDGLARKLLGFGETQKMPKFTLYPPLGTDEAYKLQAELGVDVDPENLENPTGKTGVAFGLLRARSGAEIKVVDITSNGDKVPFQFYVGRRKQKKFKVVIDRNMRLEQWHRFIDASVDTFDILYTDKATAATNNEPASIAKKITLHLDQTDPEASVYVRATNAREIQYKVARTEDELNDPQVDPITIQLKG